MLICISCKGFDIVLKAAEKIGKSVDFYIIGGEPSVENKQYKEAHNLSSVHFVDFLGKDELREYYNAADLFVLMTRGDTFGVVPLLHRSVWRGRTFLRGADLSAERGRLRVYRLPESVQPFYIR